MGPAGRLALLVPALLAVATAPAPAAVRIDRERIVVSTPAGSAVVERSPFRVAFRDAAGRTLLTHVRARTRRALRLPETLDPEPFALERRPDNATYAPLGFEVGTEARDQWDAGLWNGNLLLSRRSGTAHAARAVRSARRDGDGVRLVLSTSDARRRLVVRITPDRGGTLRVRARPSDARGVITMGDSFMAAAGEAFHGFGGRHATVDKRGEKLYGWTEQENFGGEPTVRGGVSLLPQLVRDWTGIPIERLGTIARVPEGLPGGFERYMAPNGGNAAYYPQAQFVSSRGYGFLLNQPELSRWRMASGDRPDAWQVQASARTLDYTVAPGAGPRAAVRRLTAITGRHRLPPRWAQGASVSRTVRTPAVPGAPAVETKESYRAKVEQDMRDLERHDVSIRSYAFEGYATLEDPAYVRAVIRRLRARGIRTVLYVRAYVSDDALATQPRGDAAEVERLGLAARTATGAPFVYNGNGFGPSTLLDFTNPATARWWQRKVEGLLELGADGFMQDFGEQVQDDMRFSDGSTGATMHNRYPVLFHRVTRRIVDRWARRNPDRGPVWFYTRAGYSGRPGAAAYEMGTFPGDETVDFGTASGLGSLGADMLNRAVGGAFGFTTDIGGYTDFLTGAPSEELFTRWAQWSALTPYFRVHNAASAGVRMPWSYGPRALARWKAMARLHERAMPYVRRLWRGGRRSGLPPTRPMWLAAPEAPGARAEAQQWLLGDDVLVAPVVVEGATTRTVSFPRGCWQRAGAGGRRHRGPRRATVPAPLGSLPYFVRCGTTPFSAASQALHRAR